MANLNHKVHIIVNVSNALIIEKRTKLLNKCLVDYTDDCCAHKALKLTCDHLQFKKTKKKIRLAIAFHNSTGWKKRGGRGEERREGKKGNGMGVSSQT